MGLYERIKEVAKKNNTSINKLEKELGFPRSSINKFNTNAPSYEKLKKIADYFKISIDELTGESKKDWEPDFTSKDERDVQKELERTLNSLQNDTGLMFDGEVLDDETRELLEASLEHAIRTAKITAKKKFTPNKYRK